MIGVSKATLKPEKDSRVESAEEIYRRLIAPVEERMIRIVSRIVRDPDDACDVFQEVLAVIWARLARIDRHRKPHAYILRVCVTRSYDYLRRRVRRERVERPLTVDPQYSPAESEAERSIDRERWSSMLRDSIADLPVRQATAVLLRAVDGEHYEAIGEVLGCSAATARSHFSKGRARLLKALGRQGPFGVKG